MTIKRLHYLSAIILMVFAVMHLSNHLCSLHSVEMHIRVTHWLRHIYRNPIIETLLMLSCGFQAYSGIRLIKQRKGTFVSIFEKIRLYSGVYLTFFIIAHPIAIWVGRLYLQVDTNFYFGASVLNIKPYPVFYAPYYLLGILAFFGHLAAVHYVQMQRYAPKKTARNQSWGIILFALVLGSAIIYGFTGGFRGLTMPPVYHYLPE